MNIFPVILDWCKNVPFSMIQRYSSLFFHYLFDSLDVCFSFIQSLTLSLSHSLTLSFIDLLIHSLIHSLNHSLIHSLNHSLIHSFIVCSSRIYHANQRTKPGIAYLYFPSSIPNSLAIRKYPISISFVFDLIIGLSRR